MITIRYTFAFQNKTKKVFRIQLHPETLALQEKPGKGPSWARLDFAPCDNCPLDVKKTDYYPVALRVSGVLEKFQKIRSFSKVVVTVETEERTVTKRTSVQKGLASLLGIYMVTSGCPVLEKLKPMVRYHLPFATVGETIYRAMTMYLAAQYFRMKKGLPANWDLDGLTQTYEDVNVVNAGFADRIRNAFQHDANLNALINLDIFAAYIKAPDKDKLHSLEHLFEPYLKES